MDGVLGSVMAAALILLAYAIVGEQDFQDERRTDANIRLSCQKDVDVRESPVVTRRHDVARWVVYGDDEARPVLRCVVLK